MWKEAFTLVEIIIVVAILGLLITLGVPGFITARNKSRANAEKANLKAISDNIISYGVNEKSRLDSILRLWPTGSNVSDAASYIRKQLFCPIKKGQPYSLNSDCTLGSCDTHGTESNID